MNITKLDISNKALYQLAADLDNSVLLSSCGTVELGRYIVFSALPCGQETCIKSLIVNLKQKHSTIERKNQPEAKLPFSNGWVGLYTYTKELHANYYTWSYTYDRIAEQGYISFAEDCPEWKRTVVLSSIEAVKERASALQNIKREFSALPWRKSQSADQYFDSFTRLQEYILAGDCYQANLTQRFEVNCAWSKADLIAAYASACEQSTANFSAFFDLGNGNAIASLSPERFIECKDRQITTKPIKGTVKANGLLTLAQRSELQNTKNKAENLMIVDLLRNDLSKVSKLNSVKVSELFNIESYENVHHLVSTVTSNLRDELSPIEAFIEAFPGGSITGAPKKRAMEIIEELELHSRESYCGSVFYIDSNGNLDSNILIRTIEKQKDKLYCWGGGGIVADSSAQSEYQESIDKVRHLTGIEH